MKLLFLAGILVPLTTPLALLAQRSISEFGTGSTSSIGVIPTTPTEPKTVTVVKRERLLTRDRKWTAVDGREIVGALVAHQPADGKLLDPEGLPIVVYKKGIRLKIGPNILPVPLEKISEADQEYIKKLEEAYRKQWEQRNAAAKAPAKPTSE